MQRKNAFLLSSADREPTVGWDFFARALRAHQFGKMSKAWVLCIASVDGKLCIAPSDLAASIPKIKGCAPCHIAFWGGMCHKVPLDALDQSEVCGIDHALTQSFGKADGFVMLLELSDGVPTSSGM